MVSRSAKHLPFRLVAKLSIRGRKQGSGDTRDERKPGRVPRRLRSPSAHPPGPAGSFATRIGLGAGEHGED
jgi:hypothetical protein